MKPTFKQQFDKLTEAYIRNEVNPFSSCACFVGNLLNKDSGWSYERDYFKMKDTKLPIESCIRSMKEGLYLFKDSILTKLYTYIEILQLERKFVTVYIENDPLYTDGILHYIIDEDALFKAFEATLELLKEIHISKGENVEEYSFQKRELVN